jgi:hypothetical protein
MSCRVALLTSSLVLTAALIAFAAQSMAGVPLSFAESRAATQADGAAPAVPLKQEPPSGDSYCLICHADQSLSVGFSNGETLSLYADARVLRDSAHGLMSCATCHDLPPDHPPEEATVYDSAEYESEANASCAECHQAAAAGYDGSAHSEPLARGEDGATCIQCHSPDGSGHSIAATSHDTSFLSASNVADSCGACHEQARDSYLGTSHGKVAEMGDAVTTATCVTCHGDHDTPVVADLADPAAAASLASVCSECHDGADEEFARAWPGHSEGASEGSVADWLSRAGYLVAFGVVVGGVAHASLDLFRRRSGKNRGGM